jgi:hypothetical protein
MQQQSTVVFEELNNVDVNIKEFPTEVANF